MITPNIRKLVTNDEGLRLNPYRDIFGKLTIGYGRNLDDNGISKEEAEFMFTNDLATAEADARYLFTNFDDLNEVRQAVLINMAINFGRSRLSEFRDMRIAILKKNFTLAAIEMLDSKWAKQLTNRANRLAHLMESGEWS